MKTLKLFFLCSLFVSYVLLSFPGCKKSSVVNDNKKNPDKHLIKTLAIKPDNFNWETADVMPTLPGTETILSPFAVGANQAFPAAFITDKKQSDGWQLVYNTFSTKRDVSPKFFALYNEYRGLLRAFFYLKPTSPIPSSYVSHTLKLKENGATSLLNYTTSDAVDMSNKQLVGNLIQPYRTSASGTWYAAEFEVAYDPATKGLDAISNLLEWDVNSVNISNVTINGTSSGTVTGTLTQPKAPTSSNFFGNLLFGGISSVANKGLKDSVASDIGKLKLDGFLTGILTTGLNQVVGGAGSIIKSVLSGIFSSGEKSSSTVTNVSLKTSAQINLTGSIENNSLIFSPSLIMPGARITDTASVNGFLSLYSKPMGLFCLSNPPVIDGVFSQSAWSYSSPGETDDRAVQDMTYYDLVSYQLEKNSYSIIFNPDVINNSPTGAAITNLKQELLSDYPNEYASAIRKENVDNLELYAFPYDKKLTYQAWSPQSTTPGGIQGTWSSVSPEPPQLVNSGTILSTPLLRISFNVVPNNGGPVVAVIKAFRLKVKSN
ncbi:hypothetical protein G7092_11270 [Mucilaginibacter sp. HC2]|uniref:hypothetical protein n=1 Tax=Mucilaginibacter inviolabilis TaxID=2714892 RepID=UPI001407B161|nr:hypothetical protein [Mucilaginibacter inviolabilis]NHA04381.1 hypothetical protein [Mucilaginibacter inviolabilis]